MIISLPQNLNEGRVLRISSAARTQTIGDSAADTFMFEVQLDALVDRIYGLTDEEMAIFDDNGRSDAETQRKEAPHPASPRKRGKPAAEEPMDDEVLE